MLIQVKMVRLLTYKTLEYVENGKVNNLSYFKLKMTIYTPF